MKIKVRDLEPIIAELQATGKFEFDSSTINYAVVKFANEMERQFDLYRQTRTRLLIEKAKKDQGGNPIILYENNVQRYDLEDPVGYEKQHQELLDQDIELVFTPIKVIIPEKMKGMNPVIMDILIRISDDKIEIKNEL